MYLLKLQSYSDEKLRSTQFDTFSVTPTKEFGKDFGMVNFSGITMEFVRCVTPLRVAVERVLLLMSWTSPFKTLGFLCAVSFLIYFADLIMIVVGLLLWTKLRNSVLGYLISVELPSSSDNMVEDFKKNLAFIQMLETSWVDLVTSVEDAFKGVERSKIKKAVSLMQFLPVLGILVTLQFSKSSRALWIIIIWILGVLCHPLGMEVVIDQHLPSHQGAIQGPIGPNPTQQAQDFGNSFCCSCPRRPPSPGAMLWSGRFNRTKNRTRTN